MVAKAKIYINGRLIGFHSNALKLTKDLITKRRQHKIHEHVNIAFHEDTNEVYVNTDSGRVQRPAIVVENGKPRLTEEHIKQIKDGKLSWQDLIEKGFIEYLDAEEHSQCSKETYLVCN